MDLGFFCNLIKKKEKRKKEKRRGKEGRRGANGERCTPNY